MNRDAGEGSTRVAAELRLPTRALRPPLCPIIAARGRSLAMETR